MDKYLINENLDLYLKNIIININKYMEIIY